MKQSWYEEFLGWRVKVDNRRLFMTAGVQLDALTMPAHLAVTVLAQLRIARVVSPVAAAPGGKWHTFLAAVARKPSVSPELRRARVQVVPRGGQVVIPVSCEERGGDDSWWWVEPPRPFVGLPPWSALIVATRLAVAGAAPATTKMTTLTTGHWSASHAARGETPCRPR